MSIVISILEKHSPGSIARLTGSMEICERCGSPYRRMAIGPGKFLCGACYPAPASLAHDRIRQYVAISSAKGD